MSLKIQNKREHIEMRLSAINVTANNYQIRSNIPQQNEHRITIFLKICSLYFKSRCSFFFIHLVVLNETVWLSIKLQRETERGKAWNSIFRTIDVWQDQLRFGACKADWHERNVKNECQQEKWMERTTSQIKDEKKNNTKKNACSVAVEFSLLKFKHVMR